MSNLESMPRGIDMYAFGTENNTLLFGIHLPESICKEFAATGYACYNLRTESTPTQEVQVAVVFAGVIAIVSACSATTGQLLFTTIMTILSLFLFLGMVVLSNPEPLSMTKVVDSIKWCLANTETSSLVVCGYGFGAHAAALISTNPYFLQTVGLSTKCIKACIGMDGHYSDKRLSSQTLHTKFGTRSAYYDVFPLYNVSSITPPHLLLQTHPDASAYDYHFELMQKGVLVETFYLESTAGCYRIVKEFMEQLHRAPSSRDRESTHQHLCSGSRTEVQEVQLELAHQSFVPG